MTTKTVKLVEPADLLAVHFQCKNCKAAMSFSLQGAVLQLPASCPNCNATWFEFGEGATKKAVSDFIEAHRRLLRVFPQYGCELRIELAPEPVTERQK